MKERGTGKRRNASIMRLCGCMVAAVLSEGRPHAVNAAAPEAPAPGGAPRSPFAIRCSLPADGDASMAIDSSDGRRVRNLCAQVARKQGAWEEPWDLKDEYGNYVLPGRYTLRGVVGPPLQLIYRMTPCPNVDQFWPDRTPWSQGETGPHGWLAISSAATTSATRGDRMYFGAPVAGDAVCLIECDLDGKKQWGTRSFGELGVQMGVRLLAAEEDAVYIAGTDSRLYRMDAASRNILDLGKLSETVARRGALAGMAAHGGKLYLSFTGDSPLDNAAPAAAVDIANLLPKAPQEKALFDLWRPNFFRALNIDGTRPPGTDLESTKGRGRDQYVVIPFKEPVPLGSLVFLHPGGRERIAFSVLAPNAPYPPRPRNPEDWIAFDAGGRPGWNCLPAPPKTLTRAVRITFTRPDYPAKDEEGALGEVPNDAAALKPPSLDDLSGTAPAADSTLLAFRPSAADGAPWSGRLPALKLFRRRFAGLSSSAKVRVNSGTVGADGHWDAARTEPVTPDSPGLYVMEWEQPQKVSGLAIEEIDGARTEIDVWQGPADGPIPIAGAALDGKAKATGWRNVASYLQQRRSLMGNSAAACVDGYVEFPEEVETRALRLRIVEQWLDNGENGEERFCGVGGDACRRPDPDPTRLDTRLCHVYGVEPLHYVGGEVPADPLAYERLATCDGETGELIREVRAQLGGRCLAVGPNGELFAADRRQRDIVRVDPETGGLTPVVTNANPAAMAVGPDGRFYVFPRPESSDRGPIRVYDAHGRPVRTIGKPGGFQPGPWDPQRFGDVTALCVDRGGSLWVTEQGDYPRRTIQYRTDGALVKEIVGNTFWAGGGGGVINRYQPSRAWFGRVEFELDWQKHTSRIRGLLSDRLEGADFIAMRPKDRKETYLVSARLTGGIEGCERSHCGIVYLYDDASGTARLAAAFGNGTFFAPLRAPAIVAGLKGRPPGDFTFRWSDRNGNGQVELGEVEFTPKTDRKQHPRLGPFDHDLGCMGEGVRYEVSEYLPNGAPVYREVPAKGNPFLKLDDGNLFELHVRSPERGRYGMETCVQTPLGAEVWDYGISGAGWSGHSGGARWEGPGRAGSQLTIIGHETAPEGDLGEFLVAHDNVGRWNIWTSDGLLVGPIVHHACEPGVKFFGPPESRPGTRMDPLSVGMNHLHGFFTRTEPDNRYFIVAGFTHMSILEVKGLDQYRRFAVSEVTVTPADLRRARDSEGRRGLDEGLARTRRLDVHRTEWAITLDGEVQSQEWINPVSLVREGIRASFAACYDDANLYLAWTSDALGPVRNSGTDFKRYFRTGACLDFMLGVDPGADPDRMDAVKGDLRLLVTFVEDKPQTVLYQPVAPDAAPGERWKAGEGEDAVSFDRVVLLDGATAAMKAGGGGAFSVEVSVPLKLLGLNIRVGDRLKSDWGIISPSGGTQAPKRLHWANQTGFAVRGESAEARLEPAFWGTLRFVGKAGQPTDGLPE